MSADIQNKVVLEFTVNETRALVALLAAGIGAVLNGAKIAGTNDPFLQYQEIAARVRNGMHEAEMESQRGISVQDKYW